MKTGRDNLSLAVDPVECRSASGPVVTMTSSVPFLSAPWFERARDLTACLPEQRGLSYRVQFETADQCWHQVVEDGRVVAWADGHLAGADLRLGWAIGDA